MSTSDHGAPSPEHQSTVETTIAKIASYGAIDLRRWLLVITLRQRLLLVREQTIDRVWPVSTARAGLDCRGDSGGTPAGLHRIDRKIGAQAAVGTVFSSRLPTGEVWRPDKASADDDRDLILSRILTLDGREEGVNRGPGVDSLARYIYIHGTNHESAIGQSESAGCVRMRNADVIELFELVNEGDAVVIV